MKHLLIAAVLILTTVVLLFFYLRLRVKTEKSAIPLRSIDSVPGSHWEKLATKKIFFGHQSVGGNLLDGIKAVLAEHPEIRLNIVEGSSPDVVEHPALAHAKIGRNFDPASKIKSFADLLNTGLGGQVDIAIMKFCYVDITRDSDPAAIFADYSQSLEKLKAAHPRTTFMHMTTPVQSAPNNPKKIIKACIKAILNKPGVVEDNVTRHKYNTQLKQTAEPVFDLAFYETIDTNGTRHYRTKGSEQVFMLAPEYTNDGEHLNSLGSEKVAEQFLITLAELAERLP